MRQSPLQLDRLFFPKTIVEARPAVDGKTGEMPVPQLKAVAIVERGGTLHANLFLDWDDGSKSLYDIHVIAYATFRLREEHLVGVEVLSSAVLNATALLMSSLREHVANVSARAPHGEVFLPLIALDERDIEIHLDDDELANKLGIPRADIDSHAAQSKSKKRA